VKDVPRRTAAEVVLAVERDGAYANLLLPRVLRERRLSGQDAAFATELTYGTLRWQGVMDQVVSSAANREATTLDPEVRAVLRVGAYQLLRTRVAPHAAVSTTVDLCREVAGHRPAGLVNAVMRKVGQADWPLWVQRLAPADPIGRVAFEHGYPEWVARSLLEALDGDEQELVKALEFDRPVTHLAVTPGVVDRDALVARLGGGASAGQLSPYAIRLAGGDPGGIAEVQKGTARVQDEGSQLVALALVRAPVDGRDERWLDLCAGPGGKAALVGGLLPDAATFVAAELHPHRAKLISSAARRTSVVVADGTRPPWQNGSFDRVLLDAPCSGLGALRRRPEVRWRRQPGDVPGLVALQRGLLDSALDAVRPGGLVAYVTCSPHRQETRGVVAEVLGHRGDAQQVDARPLFDEVPELGAGPDVQLWPHRHGTDAMYFALLRRNEPGSGRSRT
jgi:16S rRNA (cytosine967-C5)-methyltransferase